MSDTDRQTGATTIEIPASHFELHELVTLHWNGEQHNSRIIRRYYDLDDDVWLYGVYGVEGFYTADYLDIR